MDFKKRMAERTMEMVWKGSASVPSANVFTGAFSSGNYGAPSGLCFDRSCEYCRDDPVVSDKELDDAYNLNAKVKILANAIEFEFQHSVGDNVMLKMGSDFAWENANSWFKSMDRLITAINSADPPHDYEVIYSTPAMYTRARALEDIQWTTKTDDFFPYADCAHCYWSGYFTSRPTLKGLERHSSSFLQVLRQTTAMHATPAKAQADHTLTAAVGLVNHHDAITGTSKQHVANDYTRILSRALTGAENTVADAVELSSKSVVQPLAFTVCRFANESYCDVTQALGASASASAGAAAEILVYNPLPRTRTQQVTVFLSGDSAIAPHASVTAADGALVAVDIFPTAPSSPNPAAAPWSLVFVATNVPALSSASFRLHVRKSPLAEEALKAKISTAVRVPLAAANDADRKPLVVGLDKVSVSFDRATGLLSSITRLNGDGRPAVSAQVTNDLGYYASFGSPGIPGNLHPPKDARDPHLKNIKPLGAHASEEGSIQVNFINKIKFINYIFLLFYYIFYLNDSFFVFVGIGSLCLSPGI